MTTLSKRQGRVAMTVYLHPEMIKNVKLEALASDKHAYEIIEAALASAGFGGRPVTRDIDAGNMDLHSSK